MNEALRAEGVAAVRRNHRLGAVGLGIVLVVMGLASAMTGDWAASVLILLVLSAMGSALVFAVLSVARATVSRWSLLLWPAFVMVTLARLHTQAPTASALLPGVIVLAFLFVGLTVARGASLLLLPGAVFVLQRTAELTMSEALVRIPIAIGIWVVVAELPARLLAELRAKESELVRRAGTDTLTGALNRNDMDRRIGTLSADDVLALIDLDHFKQFNDQHGHLAGDAALTEFATVLMDRTRPEDSVFRYGGEEFLVIFPRTTIDQARVLLERISEVWRGSDSGLSFSAGLTEASAAAIDRADALLYVAKDRGRAQIVVADRPSTASGPGIDLVQQEAQLAQDVVGAFDGEEVGGVEPHVP